MDEKGSSSLVLGLSWSWLAFVAVAVAAVGAAGYLVLQELHSRREKRHLFLEASESSCLSPPVKEMQDYERRRAELFGALLSEGKVTEEESFAEGVAPHKTWLRELLSPEDRKALKVLLLRRALSNAPRWIFLSGELNAKYRLYRHGLLEEKTWLAYQEAQADLHDELEYVKLEAECLEANWGDKILRDSIMLYRLQEAQKARRKAQDAEAKEKEREEKRTENAQRSREESAARKAEKNGEELIREAARTQQQKSLHQRKGSK